VHLWIVRTGLGEERGALFRRLSQGTGVAPLTVSPASLVFPNTVEGNTSASQTVT
jgi:hypothetical protein